MSVSTPSRRPKANKSNNNRPSTGLLSIVEAWGVIAFLALLLVLGVTIPTYLIRNQPTATETKTKTVTGKQPTPPGVPLMPGMVLTRQTSSGVTSIYSYSVAQGSLASVQNYYRQALEKRDWVRQPRSNNNESEYVAPKKKLVIALSYEGSHVQIKMTYTSEP